MEAFNLLKGYLESLPKNKKQIIFFDEMPWMDTPRSNFFVAFECFWNGWGNSRDNLICIVCGYATSWMKKNFDNNKGGLYNRLTSRIYLNPFNLKETEQYLLSKNINWSRYNIVECYMIMGGIPYYLSKIDKDLTYQENIDNIFFRKRAELWDEFNFLYSALFDNSNNYIKIIEALSTKKEGLQRGEIIAKTGLPENGAITKMLNNLEYSGFIRINDFFGKKQKIYELSDYYTLFYFKFIKNNYRKDEHFWSHTLDNPSRKAWAELTFKQVCKDHIDIIKDKIGIKGVLSPTSMWRKIGTKDSTGTQIDLLIDRRNRVISICEIKFSINEYEITKEYDERLRDMLSIFQKETKTKSDLQLVMITTYGVKNNMYSSIVSNQVTLNDLF